MMKLDYRTSGQAFGNHERRASLYRQVLFMEPQNIKYYTFIRL